MLARPRFSSCQQGCHDTVACVETGREVRNCHADLHWRSFPAAGDVHEAKLCLDHYVVTGTFGVGAILAVACDRSIYEGRINVTKCLVIKAVLF
jgi:hypothetical protein